MSTPDIAIVGTGLVTPVGLDAASSCAAFRAKLTNPTETRFIDSAGEWIVAHQVPLAQPLRGLAKLAKMASMAIDETLADVPRAEWRSIPLLLCVAEAERPGRMEGLDDVLFGLVQTELDASFAAASAVIAQGRVGVAVALAQARALLGRAEVEQVLVAATDTLLTWPTLEHYERGDRLLTTDNSNGFMPGEAAGALLVRRSSGQAGELLCAGIGFGREPAPISSEEPLRGDGLTQAVKAALTDARCQMHDMDFRVTDIAGEQYYFKEASLTLSRTLRARKETFDLWHPAECTGEVGAASGATIVASVRAACEKNYTLGPNILAHMANDAGQRAALALRYRMPA